jgi:hypothetical protein
VRWLVLCAAVASTPVAANATWRWTGKADDRRAVVIDLVRGDVTVERAAAETSIAIESSSEDSQVEAVEQADSVHVSDRYPARSAVAAMADCLPPADERGDYWTYPVRFSVRVRLHPGQPLRIRLKQGNIRLPESLGRIDAATADGQVLRGASVGVVN